jgi:hypothetical protein
LWQGFFCEIAGAKNSGQMKTYRYDFDPADRDAILNLIENYSNHIEVDHTETDSVTINIDLEDFAADNAFRSLKEEIDSLVEGRTPRNNRRGNNVNI